MKKVNLLQRRRQREKSNKIASFRMDQRNAERNAHMIVQSFAKNIFFLLLSIPLSPRLSVSQSFLMNFSPLPSLLSFHIHTHRLWKIVNRLCRRSLSLSFSLSLSRFRICPFFNHELDLILTWLTSRSRSRPTDRPTNRLTDWPGWLSTPVS